MEKKKNYFKITENLRGLQPFNAYFSDSLIKMTGTQAYLGKMEVNYFNSCLINFFV